MEQVMEMVKESSELLCSDLPLLLFVTLIFLFPVSAISLTHILVSPSAAAQIHTFLSSSSAHLRRPSDIFLYRQSLQALAAEATSLPAALTLKLAAYVAVWKLATWRRSGRQRSLEELLTGGVSTWRRLALTYLCGEAVVGLLLLAFAAVVNTAAGVIVVEAAAVGALTLALPLVMAAVRVGLVAVALLPPLRGAGALLYSLSLLKLRRRLTPALLLLVFNSAASAFFEFAFHTRILNLRLSSAAAESAAFSATANLSRFLEAPLLIFGHSFVSLFDSLLWFSFFHLAAAHHSHYASSAEEAEEEEQLRSRLLQDEISDADDLVIPHMHLQDFSDDDQFQDHNSVHRHRIAGDVGEEFHDDHFTVAVEILEKQCWKLMHKKTPIFC